MTHPRFKINVTWENQFTEEQVRNIKKNILAVYPDAKFLTISNQVDAEENEHWQLSITHSDYDVVNNLCQRVNCEIRKL